MEGYQEFRELFAPRYRGKRGGLQNHNEDVRAGVGVGTNPHHLGIRGDIRGHDPGPDGGVVHVALEDLQNGTFIKE